MPVIVLGVIRVHCRAGCGFGETVLGIAPSHPPKGVSVGIGLLGHRGTKRCLNRNPIVGTQKGVSVGIRFLEHKKVSREESDF